MKAKLRGASQYQEDFTKSRCVLPISVGSASQEGEKISAILKTIEKRFYRCDIVLADTLQRFNLLSEGYTESEALQLSRSKGDEWLERHEAELSRFSIPHQLIRWDQCTEWETFKKWLKIIKQEYEKNSVYKNSFFEDIAIFLSRKKQQVMTRKISKADFFNSSLDSFFEEIAVVLSYFLAHQYDFIIYPSAMPKSISKSLELFLAPSEIALLRHLGVYFR